MNKNKLLSLASEKGVRFFAMVALEYLLMRAIIEKFDLLPKDSNTQENRLHS